MGDEQYHPILNQGFTTRSSKSGRQRVTVECRSEPIVHNLDPKQLGAGPAAAIAQHIRDRISGIVARASDATIERRKRAAREASEGMPTASRRYAGGRIGSMPPDQSDRLFNDSGRLAKSIVARAAQGAEYVINVAANRLDSSTFKAGAFSAMLDRLAQYVPELRNSRLLAESIPVQRAIRDGMAQMIQKQEARISELREARTQAIVGLGRAALGLVA